MQGVLIVPAANPTLNVIIVLETVADQIKKPELWFVFWSKVKYITFSILADLNSSHLMKRFHCLADKEYFYSIEKRL